MNTTTRRLRIAIPAVLVLLWFVAAGIGGPYFGKVDEVAQNDQSTFLPSSAESTVVGERYLDFVGSESIPAIVIVTGEEKLTEEQLADSAREILDAIYAKDLKELHETFFELQANGLASSDLSDLARAAAFGAIDILAIDMNAEVAGSVTDGGALELDTEHDALEDIARRALLSGAQVLALREDDMPGELQATGILRYSF